MAKGKWTFVKNSRGANIGRLKVKRLRPSLSIVKARIPSIERVVVEGKRKWVVDDQHYDSLEHVVIAHPALFPEYEGKFRLPSTVVETPNQALEPGEGEWECECEEDYIKSDSEPACPDCGYTLKKWKEENA